MGESTQKHLKYSNSKHFKGTLKHMKYTIRKVGNAIMSLSVLALSVYGNGVLYI